MTTELRFPKSLQETILQFSAARTCTLFLAEIRWPDGATCPHCKSKHVGFVNSRLIWNCLDCKKQFSVKAGSLLEDSALKLSTWLPAIWLVVNAKNGISSCEVARALSITQKSAWFVLHRVRMAMAQGSFEKLKGTVECDESFIGGKEKNKHVSKKQNNGRGGVGKEIVMGILERGGEINTKVISDTSRETLHNEVKANVESGAEVFTDAHKGYRGLPEEYKHAWVDHMTHYAEGRIHCNGVENFWALFDRMLDGTYVHCDPRHLSSYLDEETHRFNLRKLDDSGRFAMTVASLFGKRLT